MEQRVFLSDRIYHGTSESVALKALSEGLIPRNDRSSTWSQPSRSDCVYLTEAYAAYFAANACFEGGERERWAIIELDTKYLTHLVPDEDAMEQGTRNFEPCDLLSLNVGDTLEEAAQVARGDMAFRTRYFRDRAHKLSALTPESLRLLGNCAHVGPIPPEAISRVSLFDPKKNGLVAGMSLDPNISVFNYQFCGEKYRNLTRWFFGEAYDWGFHAFGEEVPWELLTSYVTGTDFSSAKAMLEDRAKTLAHPQDSLTIIDNQTWRGAHSA